MKRSPHARKTPSELSASVHQRLNTYALAAGAAGVSLLALAQPSEGEIIYTPTHATVGRNGSYAIDLNHDGIVDFVISEQGRKIKNGAIQSLRVEAAPNNQINCRYSFCGSTGGVYATALSLGNEIGPSPVPHGWAGKFMGMATEIRSGTFVTYLGDFRYARSNYLGLRFQIDGETHYGWARL